MLSIENSGQDRLAHALINDFAWELSIAPLYSDSRNFSIHLLCGELKTIDWTGLNHVLRESFCNQHEKMPNKRKIYFNMRLHGKRGKCLLIYHQTYHQNDLCPYQLPFCDWLLGNSTSIRGKQNMLLKSVYWDDWSDPFLWKKHLAKNRSLSAFVKTADAICDVNQHSAAVCRKNKEWIICSVCKTY